MERKINIATPEVLQAAIENGYDVIIVINGEYYEFKKTGEGDIR